MVSLNLIDQWSDTKRIHVIGTFVLTGNYVTGGDPIPFGSLPTGLTQTIKSNSPVVFCIAQPEAGYSFRITFGSTTINGSNLKVLYPNGAAVPMVEIPQAAYPAALLTGNVNFHAIFNKYI